MSCAATAIQTSPAASPSSSTAGAPDRKQRDAMIIDHLPLVRAIATRVRESLPVQVELDDLVHAGVIGLIDAIQKYDPNKRVVFHLYAKHRIRGAILDSLRQLDWASRDLRKRSKRIEGMTQKLAHRLGRTPTESELAREMGVSLPHWRKLVLEVHSAGLGPGQGHTSGPYQDSLDRFSSVETSPSHSALPDGSCARHQLQQVLAAALQTLPPRYQRVVVLYYSHGSTMKQIGAELGVNESRISQIHKAALEKLHSALRTRGFHSTAMFLGD